METQQVLKIFIASSSEMHHERIVLSDLFADMSTDNMIYQPVKWEYVDTAVNKQKRKEDQYLQRLHDCGVCITMLWKSLGQYTVEEFNDAIKRQHNADNPKKVFVLIKKDNSDVKPELVDFINELEQQHKNILRYFSNDSELKRMVGDLLTKDVIVDGIEEANDDVPVKEVYVMVAADRELNEDMMEFTDVIAHLNEIMVSHGIRLHRVKWTHDIVNVFKQQVNNCEMCLNLYWKKLPENSSEEINYSYNAMQDGKNPQRLYIFFKEPSKEITNALSELKNSFETKFGHFYCKYENVDSMSLNFILQLMALSNNALDSLINVTGGNVFIGDRSIVNLDNVPFAALNKEYCRLRQKVNELENKLLANRKLYMQNVNDEDLWNKSLQISRELEDTKKEFDKYQNFLFEKAKLYAQTCYERYSEVRKLSHELFEKGDVVEADRVLNPDELRREKDRQIQLSEQNDKNLEQLFYAFKDKVVTSMLNYSLSASDRFNNADGAYEDAYDIAKTAKYIYYKYKEVGDLLFEHAQFLSGFNKYDKAIRKYTEAIEYYQQLTDNKMCLARTLHELGSAERLWSTVVNNDEENTTMLDDSEKKLQKALDLYMQLQKEDRSCGVWINIIINDLGLLNLNKEQFDDAVDCFLYALDNMNKSDKSLDNQLDILVLKSNIVRGAYYSNQEKRKNAAPDLASRVLNDTIELLNDHSKIINGDNIIALENPEQFTSICHILEGCKVVLEMEINFDEISMQTYKLLDLLYNKLISLGFVYYIPKRLENLLEFTKPLCVSKMYKDAMSNYKTAIELLEELIKEKSDDYLDKKVVTLVNMSYCEIMLKEYNKAEEYSMDALSIDPNHHFAYSNLAPALLFQGKVDEAEKIYKEYKNELKDTYLKDFEQFEQECVVPEEYKNDVERIKTTLLL